MAFVLLTADLIERRVRALCSTSYKEKRGTLLNWMSQSV